MSTKASVRVWTMLRVVALARREKYLTEFAANMAYRVEFAARAARDLEILYIEKNTVESHAAARWYNGLWTFYILSEVDTGKSAQYTMLSTLATFGFVSGHDF